jgi:hypothetical protein
MTILKSRPGEFIRIRLEFLKPFAATNTAEFTFSPEGDQTRVTWAMYGNQKFVNKAFCMVRFSVLKGSVYLLLNRLPSTVSPRAAAVGLAMNQQSSRPVPDMFCVTGSNPAARSISSMRSAVR